MRIYFSLKNLIEFIKKTELQEKDTSLQGIEFDDVKNLVTKNSERYLCFSKNEFSELENTDPKKHSMITRWLMTRFSQNQNDNSELEFKCSEKFGEFHTDIKKMSREQLMSVYLVSEDLNLKQLGLNKSVIVCDELGKEYEILQNLFNKYDNSLQYKYVFNYLNNRNEGKERYWGTRFANINYLSDILVIDPYLFHPKNRFSIETIRENIINILKILISKTKSTKINIVIRTSIKGPRNEPRDIANDKEHCEYLKEKLNNVAPTQEINITIISDWKNDHCRELITNYDHFHSGGGFCLFNDQGEYITDRIVQFTEKLTKFDVYKDKIEIFKNTSKRLGPGFQERQIYGDKKSKFIQFTDAQ